jgi:RNA-directed DNA polymerase
MPVARFGQDSQLLPVRICDIGVSMSDQHAHLTAMMRGHYAYYGISGNFRRISWYAYQVARIWQKWLSRRDRRNRLRWGRFAALLKRHPLPAARIVHRYTAASETLS